VTGLEHEIHAAARAAPLSLAAMRSLGWRGGVGLLLVACLFARGASAGTIAIAHTSDDTFINSINPNNNNGGSASIFTGTDGLGGTMRGLVRFDLPASLQGRAAVTSVQLRLTIQALGNGTAGTSAVLSLQAVSEPWIQGNGVGSSPGAFTVGQACGGSVTGATWAQANCTTATSWTTPGATVSATVSGSASNDGVGVGSPITWSTGGMNADVQSWLDAPAGNHGWRITSSTEGAPGSAQRFFSSETGASGPSLSFSYSCKTGFQDTGTTCETVAPVVPAATPRAKAALALALGALGLLAIGRVRRGR
jgi:hypothetical protein